MTSQFINTHYLTPLLSYMFKRGHISRKMRSTIKSSHSFKADLHHEESFRSFCFVVLGERTIHYATALKSLPDSFIVGILLHEIVHMIVENEKGDPEITVDQWVTDNMPECGYEYKNVRYIDFDQKARRASNLECVSEDFLMKIGI